MHSAAIFPPYIYDSPLQGISDTPAWIVSKANQYAKDHGKTPFSVYQGNWSILERSFERDIIPMARSEGLALAPWGVLGGGKIRTNAEEARRKESGEKGRTVFNPNWERTPEEKKVCDILEEIAKEIGTESITAGMWCLALIEFWVMRPDDRLKLLSHITCIRYHTCSPSSADGKSSNFERTSWR